MIFDKIFHPFSNKKSDKAEQTKVKTDNSPEEELSEEDYSFEGTAKANSDNVGRNLLLSSLAAMSLMASPIVYTAYSEGEDDFHTGISRSYNITNEQDQAIIDKADSLSKEGRYENVLEYDEFNRMLDYSALEGLPKSTKETIKICSRSNYLPINMNNAKAKEEIIKQYKNAQWSINHLAKEAKTNPMKSSTEAYWDYAINNITDNEILDQVDFSELAYYQKDIGFVKGLINFSREKIKRDDIHAAEKEQKAVENAQKLVDKITNEYKTRAKVSGNYDGDYTLTKGELASLLDMRMMEGLPEPVQMRIIAKALIDYKPESLSHVKNKDDVKKENERVEEARKKAQEKLNDWCYRAQQEFYHLNHPDELRVLQKD